MIYQTLCMYTEFGLNQFFVCLKIDCIAGFDLCLLLFIFLPFKSDSRLEDKSWRFICFNDIHSHVHESKFRDEDDFFRVLAA